MGRPRPSSGARSLLCLTLVGCSAGPETAFVELPSTGSAASMLVVSHRGRSSRVLAVELGAEGSPKVQLSELGEDDLELLLLLYSCPLESLGLPSGELRLHSQGGMSLPPSSFVYRRSLEPDRSSAEDWTQLPEVPSSLSSIRLDYEPARICADFTVNIYSIPDLEEEALVTFLEELPEGAALLGTSSGGFFRLTLQGASRVDALGPELPHDAGTLRGSDELYLYAASTGRVVRTDPEGRSTTELVRTSSTSEAPPHGMVTSAIDEPLEILFLGAKGRVHRFDGSAWSDLDAGGHEWVDNFQPVARTGPERFTALTRSGAVSYADGSFREEAIGLPLDGGVDTLFLSPELGLLAGMNHGGLYRAPAVTGDAWIALRNMNSSSEGVRLMRPLDEGILLGGAAGNVTQYHPWLPTCVERTTTVHSGKLDVAARVAGGYVLLTRDAPHEVTALRRNNPRVPCHQPIDL